MLNIAEIAPLIRLPRKLNIFDYTIPDEYKKIIQPGQVVEIPWKKRFIQGIIFNIKDEESGAYKYIKPIKSIVEKEPVLLPYQIKLALVLSQYYLVSLPHIVKMMNVAFPKRKSNVLKRSALKFTEKLQNYENDEQIKTVQESEKKFFLYKYQLEKEKNNFLFNTMNNFLEQEKQVLILQPKILDLENFTKLIPQEFEKYGVSVLSSKVTRLKSKYFQEWSDIRFGRKKIILGTRLSLFASFNNLGLIVIDNEQELEYKQYDQNPRYQAQDVAKFISKIIGCKVIFSSQSLSVDSYYQCQKRNYVLLEGSKIDYKKIKAVNLLDENKKGNYTMLSEKLVAEIQENIERKKQVALFLNRRGFATTVICNDCGHVFKCPDCDINLILYKNSNLLCHHCNYSLAMPLQCPKCGGPNFNYLGTGIQKVEETLKTLFPKEKIARIDSETDFSKDLIEKSSIIIGTSLIFSQMNWKNLGLGAIIFADSLFYIPDFKALEKTFQFFKKIVNKMQENDFSADLLIQTKSIENKVLQAILQNDDDIFYKSELENRKNFAYPPYYNLVKLIYHNVNKDICFSEAKKLAFLLQRYNKNKDVTIYDPINTFILKIRGKYRQQIIVKFQNKDLDYVNTVLDYAPDSWLIDKNPDSLL